MAKSKMRLTERDVEPMLTLSERIHRAAAQRRQAEESERARRDAVSRMRSAPTLRDRAAAAGRSLSVQALWESQPHQSTSPASSSLVTEGEAGGAGHERSRRPASDAPMLARDLPGICQAFEREFGAPLMVTWMSPTYAVLLREDRALSSIEQFWLDAFKAGLHAGRSGEF
jgi:hypothetical protein